MDKNGHLLSTGGTAMKSRFGEVNLMFEAESLKASSRYSSLSVQQFVNAYNTDKGRPWLCLIENESSEKTRKKFRCQEKLQTKNY